MTTANAPAGAPRQVEQLTFVDPKTQIEHCLKEEEHLFRWTATQHKQIAALEPKPDQVRTADFGLVPPGVYVAIYNLLQYTRDLVIESKYNSF